MKHVFRPDFIFAAIAVALFLLLLQWLLRGDPSQRNWELFTEMSYSVAGESFAQSAALPGGQVLQALPAGVVVRGASLFPYGPDESEAARAGAELTNPFSPEDAGVKEEGARLYGIFCMVCHGADGGGQGPAIQRGMVPAAAFQAASAMEMKDGQMFHVLTMGKGNMRSFKVQLTPEERWKVIHFVRTLQEAP